MKTSEPFWISFVERFVGCVFLAAFLPTLLLIAFLIHSTAGSPIILTDEVPNNDGAVTRLLRFRTTGHGTTFFRAMGR